MSKPDPDSLAYTAHGLPPHVDLVSREAMPGSSSSIASSSRRRAETRCSSTGFACAAELARTDPSSYELLTTTPLLWRYRDGSDTDLWYRGPMIRLDPSGALREVRCSNTLLAPLDVPPDRTLDTYRAVRAFVGIVRSRRFEIRVRLQPGDDVLRQLPDPSRPDRVRPEQRASPPAGLLLDRDDFLSRIRTLEAGDQR